MATLKELWSAGGGKPIKVAHESFPDDEWFMLLGFSPRGKAIGYYDNGCTGTFDNISPDWSLYQEPRPKKKLYAYLRVDNGKIINPIHCLVFADSEMNFTPTSSQDKYKMIRVPQFDVEIEE